MTVIAYDGRYLVADGRATMGTTLVSDKEAKLTIQTVAGLGRCCVGLAGALDVRGPYLMHLKNNGIGTAVQHEMGGPHEEPLSMRGFVVTNKGICFEVTSEGGFFQVDNPTAIGSGCFVANHFLLTGHDAITAVKEACKSELSCGGDLMIYNIATKSFDHI